MGFRLTYNLALPGVFCRFHTVINLFFLNQDSEILLPFMLNYMTILAERP